MIVRQADRRSHFITDQSVFANIVAGKHSDIYNRTDIPEQNASNADRALITVNHRSIFYKCPSRQKSNELG